MEQYIDKSAIVAEIKRRIALFQKEKKTEKGSAEASQMNVVSLGARIAMLEEILPFLDTLEVKEVDEVPVSNDLEEAIEQSFIYHESHGDDFRSDKQIETAYRCGFKSGVKLKELTSIIEDTKKQNLEMNKMDLEKEIKDYFDNQPIITRSKGIDYRLIPSGEDIAKHFYELGLERQKGK